MPSKFPRHPPPASKIIPPSRSNDFPGPFFHSNFPPLHVPLEFLLLVEEHAKADNGPVDQKAANYGHDHGLNLDEIGVREDDR